MKDKPRVIPEDGTRLIGSMIMDCAEISLRQKSHFEVCKQHLGEGSKQ